MFYKHAHYLSCTLCVKNMKSLTFFLHVKHVLCFFIVGSDEVQKPAYRMVLLEFCTCYYEND